MNEENDQNLSLGGKMKVLVIYGGTTYESVTLPGTAEKVIEGMISVVSESGYATFELADGSTLVLGKKALQTAAFIVKEAW